MVRAKTLGMSVPASAEIILEGVVPRRSAVLKDLSVITSGITRGRGVSRIPHSANHPTAGMPSTPQRLSANHLRKTSSWDLRQAPWLGR
jgi:hypothetical protein